LRTFGLNILNIIVNIGVKI